MRLIPSSACKRIFLLIFFYMWVLVDHGHQFSLFLQDPKNASSIWIQTLKKKSRFYLKTQRDEFYHFSFQCFSKSKKFQKEKEKFYTSWKTFDKEFEWWWKNVVGEKNVPPFPLSSPLGEFACDCGQVGERKDNGNAPLCLYKTHGKRVEFEFYLSFKTPTVSKEKKIAKNSSITLNRISFDRLHFSCLWTISILYTSGVTQEHHRPPR